MGLRVCCARYGFHGGETLVVYQVKSWSKVSLLVPTHLLQRKKVSGIRFVCNGPTSMLFKTVCLILMLFGMYCYCCLPTQSYTVHFFDA